jgi:cell division protein FtsZ
MKDSGVSIMGSSAAEGENRALKAVEGALSSPLLKDNEIEGARYILLNISSGVKEVTMDEVTVITDYIQEEAGLAADVIWGNCIDESLGEKLSVTIIATGFQTMDEREKKEGEKKIISILDPTAPLQAKPVNEFINPAKAETVSGPYLKQPKEHKEDSKQTALFDLQPRKEEPAIVKHNLFTEEPPAVENEIANMPEMTFKVVEPEEISEPFKELKKTEPEPEITVGADDDKTDQSIEEQLRKSRERIMRLKELSMKLRSGNLQEMENVPAYKRKEISLQQTPASDETQISRFSLLPGEDGKVEIRTNNTYLHDQVD